MTDHEDDLAHDRERGERSIEGWRDAECQRNPVILADPTVIFEMDPAGGDAPAPHRDRDC